MLDRLESLIKHLTHSLILRGYGWKPRKYFSFGNTGSHWQEPYSGLWYSENTALKLVKIQAVEQYYKQ